MTGAKQSCTAANSCGSENIQWDIWTGFFAIGIVNLFWGNDLGFGAFIILLSFFFFLLKAMLKKMPGFSIPGMSMVKILLDIFVMWAALGLGELSNKLVFMRMNVQNLKDYTDKR